MAETLNTIGPVVLIGAGKMGLAMAQGWVAGGLPADRLVLVDPLAGDPAKSFAADTGVRLMSAVDGVLTHVMVLAVKPQNMPAAMMQVVPAVGRHTLVISIAAGISLATLAAGLDTQRVIRAMPNTPAQIGKGITGAVGLEISDTDREVAQLLLQTAGDVEWFDDERMIDAVTAVSGSGPAYVFHLVEALAAAAELQGFDKGQAMRFARQTVIGAAGLLAADDKPAATLRENVTSPKGTTAAALAVLMGPDGLTPLMQRTVQAARDRSEELGRA
jgi:pyrroline-5-carboxylate reductase